jgi:DNA-binding response OmpR family regulator
VEDEGDIRQLVRFQLERHGHAVCEAETGEAALTLGGTERPALVILDLMLPDADGYALWSGG